MKHLLAVIACLSVGLAPTAALSEPPTAKTREDAAAQARSACAACLANLEHAQYTARHQAAAQLKALAADPATADVAAQEIQRAWHSADLSFEARKLLEPLLPQLASFMRADIEPPLEKVEPAALLSRLTQGTFAEREAAERQLTRLLRDPEQIAPIRNQLKQSLADEHLVAADRSMLLQAWSRVRAAWLLSDMPASNHDQADEERITLWLDRLAAPSPPAGHAAAWIAHATAARELLDVLANDDGAAKLRPRLEEKLADLKLPAEARRQLEPLLEWTRPVLVAEYWENGRNLGLQYLYVDVPTTPEHGLRPTHFDRVDDSTAHCASGNSLAPGDYPVGILFPHPRVSGAQFRLVNLSTPYRRMRHEQEVRLPDADRWTEASRRTLDRYLQRGQSLSPDELGLLFDLDPAALSRFAGPYFQRVEDGHFLKEETGPSASHPLFGDLGRISRHNCICLILAQCGTSEAVPGLVKAIESGRIEPPTRQARYHMGWIAALSIARRDAWPRTDTWLAGLLDRTDPLVVDMAAGSQLGATAAAILLKRHDALPESFGLAKANAELTDEFEWLGYRCHGSSEEALARVRLWWQAESPAASRE
ncbi:MAG: hypothetical protein AB7O62_21995 [Pirellulales bacterium]